MSEDILVSNILHDLAGMMTSVQGLAQILERKSDHPSRDEFTAMLSSEADRAAFAVKDLQLVRALEDGSPVEDLQEVSVGQLFLAIRERLSDDLRHGFAPPPPDLPSITVDLDLLADLIARIYEHSSQTNPSEDHHIAASVGEGQLIMHLTLGPLTTDPDMLGTWREGRKGMRPAAIASRLLPRWGGSVDTEPGENAHRLAIRLPIIIG